MTTGTHGRHRHRLGREGLAGQMPRRVAVVGWQARESRLHSGSGSSPASLSSRVAPDLDALLRPAPCKTRWR